MFHVFIASLPIEVRRWTQMLGFVVLMGMATGVTLVCYECNVWTALFLRKHELSHAERLPTALFYFNAAYIRKEQ